MIVMSPYLEQRGIKVPETRHSLGGQYIPPTDAATVRDLNHAVLWLNRLLVRAI